MADPHRLTDAEPPRFRRRASVRASLACEGMVLTAEEEALFDAMERERLVLPTSGPRASRNSVARKVARKRLPVCSCNWPGKISPCSS